MEGPIRFTAASPASPMPRSRELYPLTSKPKPSGWMLRGDVSA